jgi:predicted acetyltransferase
VPLKIDLQRALRAQQEVLRHLMQLYVYDFSEILGLEVEDDGRFAQPPLDACWDDPRRHPFLIRAGERLAGFALVHRGSRLSGDPDVWDMAEFFVLRKHRRAGVGLEAARQVFALHRGGWEVRQRREATAATAFWRRAIGECTGGVFTEVDLDDGRWSGPMQRFTS